MPMPKKRKKKKWQRVPRKAKEKKKEKKEKKSQLCPRKQKLKKKKSNWGHFCESSNIVFGKAGGERKRREMRRNVVIFSIWVPSKK